MRLILNDGTVIEGGHAGLAGGYLWMWLPGWTMLQAAEKFLNPEVTSRISFELSETEVYEGYTNCTVLMVRDGEEFAVCMTKGVM